MANKDLNIRLGLIFDERSLSKVENQLRRSGEKLSRLGDALTLSVSAPLAALGAGSIKAAGDLQSLTLALESQLGSAEAAKKEFAALTEAAKNPGIGLEEAVRASVRLQGVKFSAEEARGTILELGNALASTGGTAADLERVTRQFAQMTSKGRVLQEDVSIISESMPAISSLMQKAFGTANVEAIREMGVGGKEFVLAITEAAKELPRVQGGIKNSIGNALDAIKQSAAKVGEAINSAFDIAGTAESFGNFLVGLAEGFSSLNPAVQSFVVYLGAALVAAGPLAKVMGSLQLLGGQLVSIWGGMVGALKGVSAWVSATTTAFNALNFATRAFILVGVVTAVAALAYNFGLFNRELSANEKAQAAVNNLELEAKKSIAGEKAEVDRLIGVINSEVASRDAKAKALNTLKQISPAYFGQLKEENGLIVGLTESYTAYIDSLFKSAKASAARGKLVQIEEQLLEIEQKHIDQINEVNAQYGKGTEIATQVASGFISAYQKQTAALDLQKRALADVVAANEDFAQVVTDTKKKLGDNTEALERAKEMAKLYKEVLSDIANERSRQSILGAKDVVEEATVIENGLKKLLDAGFKPTSQAVQNLKGQLQGLFGEKPANFDQLPTLPTPTSVTSEGQAGPTPQTVDTSNLQQYLSFAEQLGEVNTKFQESAIGFNTAFSETARLVQEQGTVMQQIMFGVADAVQEAALSGETSFKALAGAAVAAAAKVVRSWIQQGVAAAVAKALGSLPFPANIVAGGLAGGLAAAAFTKAIRAIGVPKFARGTNFAPGGLSLVGEQGPELMNVPRGAQIASNQRTNRLLNNMGGGGMTVSGELRGRGTELYAVIKSVESKNKRTT